MISPWQPNGTAIKYVKANPHRVNYVELVSMLIMYICARHGTWHRYMELLKVLLFYMGVIPLWFMGISKG